MKRKRARSAGRARRELIDLHARLLPMHDVVDPNTAAWSRGQLKALKAGEAIDNLMGWEVNAPARYHFTFPWTLTEDDRAEYQGTEAALREDARRSGGGHVD